MIIPNNKRPILCVGDYWGDIKFLNTKFLDISTTKGLESIVSLDIIHSNQYS